VSQLDETLSKYKELSHVPRPSKGWINAIRRALGMTAQQLGARTGMSQAAITQIEMSEVKKTATIATMEKIARGLDCTLVYGLVPNTTLAQTLKSRITEVARQKVLGSARSMALENQGIPDEQTQRQIELLAEEIMATLPRYIWDQDAD
jgi:predicted DNA-binding mobile mystery protein A